MGVLLEDIKKAAANLPDLTKAEGKGMDDNWFEAFKGGDIAAFEQFYHVHYYAFLTFAIIRLKSYSSQAADVVQDSFGKIWKHKGKLKNKEHARSSMFKIIQNACVDLQKAKATQSRNQPAILSILPRTAESPEAHRIQAETIAEIHEHILALTPPNYRRAIQLFFYEGKRAVEVAAEMDISLNAALLLKSRALQKLRDRIVRHLVVILYFSFFWKVSGYLL